MIRVTVAARCLRCDWTAAGDWDDVERAAEKHAKAKPGHPTATLARPATTTDVPAA